MDDGQNRRRESRTDHSSRVLYREYLLTENKPDYTASRLIDISIGGISFSTPEAHSTGDVLEVRLLLEGWEKCKTEFYFGDPRRATEPLVALVEIVSIDEEEDTSQLKIGAKFTSIDSWHKTALSKYLEKFPTKPAPKES